MKIITFFSITSLCFLLVGPSQCSQKQSSQKPIAPLKVLSLARRESKTEPSSLLLTKEGSSSSVGQEDKLGDLPDLEANIALVPSSYQSVSSSTSSSTPLLPHNYGSTAMTLGAMSGPVQTSSDEHEAFAQHIQTTLGRDFPVELIAKHGLAAKHKDIVASLPLPSSAPTRGKKAIPADDASSDCAKDENKNNSAHAKEGLAEVLADGLLAEFEGNKVRAKKDCQKLATAVVVGGMSLAYNFVQHWLGGDK